MAKAWDISTVGGNWRQQVQLLCQPLRSCSAEGLSCISVEHPCQHSTSQTAGATESCSAVGLGPGAELGSGGEGWRLRFILFACEALLHLGFSGRSPVWELVLTTAGRP